MSEAITLGTLGIAVRDNGREEQRTACPQCSKSQRDDAMGVNIETGVFHCFRCGWSGKAGDPHVVPTRIVRYDDPAVVQRKRDRLRAMWRETVSLTHLSAHAVRQYLASRGLVDILQAPPKVLRAHPGLAYWDGTKDLGRFPAMVALFHDATGQPVTLHVTYLRADGCAKAPVPSPKKIMGVPVRGATKGGAIHLHEPRNGVLAIAEGIESALSFHLLQGFPVWATYCADNLARVRLPHDLRALHIGMDLDESGKGEAVARELAQRVKRSSRRTEVTLWRPEVAGKFGDLNDDLRRRRQS